MDLTSDTMFFGTYKLLDQDIINMALTSAVQNGIRHFDFAELYRNQHFIGEFFDNLFATSKFKRSDFWFTSKVSFRSIPKGDDAIRKSIDKTLSDLRTSYLDIMLIHAPTKNNILCWNILREYRDASKIKYIGISNFNTTELSKFYSEISNPQDIYCNQLEFNPFLNRLDLIKMCQDKNIKLSCYGTLYKTNDFIDSLQAKYNRNSKQILIQYAKQVGFNPIIMAQTDEHINQDFCYDKFIIDSDDMQKLNSFNEDYSQYKRYL